MTYSKMQHSNFSKIIVLLATYNGEAYLDEQIKSILNQKNIAVEILIRDDGSIDNTIKLCKQWVEIDNRVHFISNEIQTGTPAGNFYQLLLEVEKLEGYEYVAFADQDDIWCSEKLFAAVTAMGKMNSGYSSNLFAYSNELGRTWIVNKFSKQTQYDYLFQGASAGCTYVLKVEMLPFLLNAIRSVNFETLKYISHDWLIYAAVRAAGFRWFIDNSAYIFYRQHLYNNYGDVRGFLLIQKKWNLLKSGWYKNQVNTISSVITPNPTVIFFKKNIIDSNILNILRYIRLLLKSRRKFSESLVIIIMLLLGFL